MTSLVMGQIELRGGDVPCPVTSPGQSQPRLPGHPWGSSSSHLNHGMSQIQIQVLQPVVDQEKKKNEHAAVKSL